MSRKDFMEIWMGGGGGAVKSWKSRVEGGLADLEIWEVGGD